jgi:exodeoxyribonuclease VII large subunit
MATSINSELISYNPSSLLNIFNNALTIEVTKKAFRIRGIYITGKGLNYAGFYYDSLKDETSEACVTLIVPAPIRHDLTNQETIECTGYLTKRVQLNGGKIELHVNVVELLSQQESKYTEEQIKGFEILQKKAEQGYKDVDAFIKTRIIQQQPITVTILVGKTAIIDSDIKHQLKEAIGFYDFRFVRINLSFESEIINALHAYNEGANILVVARGDGENMEVFNRYLLAEQALSVNCFFITAIGHKEDISLLQKVADKAFITPTALGQYFNEIYNQTIEELQGSKAKLVEDITKQLKGNYEMQIVNLNDKLQGNKEMSEQQLQIASGQIDELKSQLAKKTSMQYVIWLLVALAAIIGVLIGKGCN